MPKKSQKIWTFRIILNPQRFRLYSSRIFLTLHAFLYQPTYQFLRQPVELHHRLRLPGWSSAMDKKMYFFHSVQWGGHHLPKLKWCLAQAVSPVFSISLSRQCCERRLSDGKTQSRSQQKIYKNWNCFTWVKQAKESWQSHVTSVVIGRLDEANANIFWGIYFCYIEEKR